MFKNLTFISTKNMTREQWLEERRKSIGGSDAASLLGLNEYTSAYALWAEKSGKLVPDDISDVEAVRLGNDLEQYAAERWMDRTGKKVRRCNYIIKSGDIPFAHANVDRLVVGEDSGLELKTTSSWEIAKQCRNGDIPNRYYVQCVHYMMVTGAERWYLGILCFGYGFFEFTIERDEAEIAALFNAEKDFWSMVESDTPPSIDGSEATTEAIKAIYHESNGISIDLSSVSDSISLYNSLAKQIKELSGMQDEAANVIKSYLGNAEKGSVGDTTVSWKSSTRKTFDKDMYEKINGRIPDNFYKVTEVRTFRVTEKKGA